MGKMLLLCSLACWLKMEEATGERGKRSGVRVGLTWFAGQYGVERIVQIMAMGKVKWFNDQKGFGFITPDGGGPDVMVHHSVIEGQGFRTLDDGEAVEYEAEKGPKGLKATRVRRMAPVNKA